MSETEQVNELERYEQAAEWRAAVLPAIRDAQKLLVDALAASPSSLESVKLTRAITAAREAQKECERNLAIARRMVVRERQQR